MGGGGGRVARCLAARFAAAPRHEQKDVVRYQNVGAVCLSPRSAGGTHVQAVLNGCVSGCAETEASCSAVVADGVVHLEAQGSTTRTWDGDCPDVCLQVNATCSLPEVPAGMYELRHGSAAAPIELPVASPRTEVLPGADAGDCSSAPVLP